MEYVTLANGVKMPQLGYGVYQVTRDECERCVADALKVGYRHIDTAQSYFNEEEVGNAIKKSGIPRNELFITTKVWIEHYGYEACRKSVLESLRKLQLDYIDLVLLHQPFADYYGAWRALEELYAEGKLRAIGVSNFLPHHLVPLLARARVKPMVNQLEIHPGYAQPAAVNFCRAKGIQVQAWSPLGRGTLLRHALLEKIAAAHGKTPAQVALRWCIERGIAPIPKSTLFAHQQENLNVFDFSLTPEEVNELTAMPQTSFSGLHPDTVTF